jgi:2-dehydropantoate 2-reductase
VAEVKWPSIVVVGAGAVGCYFGGMLARAGAPVTLIGRKSHVEAVTQNGLLIESLHFRQYIPVSASTEVSAVRTANVVLLCVKTPDTEEAAKSLVPHLAGDAVVVSLQNGVDNVERIRSATGIEALAAVVYIAAEMTAPGCVKHNGWGDLIIGDFWRRDRNDPAFRRQLESLATLFGRAGIPCPVSENVEADLWKKLIINCAYNAISALSRARYRRVAGNPWTRDLTRDLIKEVLAVARAAGVDLGNTDMVEAGWKLADTMPNAISSTAQDISRGKHTEIDALNGYVARRGAELGVATPINRTLQALVKLLEQGTPDETGYC